MICLGQKRICHGYHLEALFSSADYAAGLFSFCRKGSMGHMEWGGGGYRFKEFCNTLVSSAFALWRTVAHACALICTFCTNHKAQKYLRATVVIVDCVVMCR